MRCLGESGVGGLVDDDLAVEDMCQLILCHSYARVSDGKLYVFVAFSGTDADAAALMCEFASVVGQCVQHEQREHLVGFHLGHCGFYLQVDAFHSKAAASHCHDVEERL